MIVQRPAWLAGGFALLLSAAGATGQGTFQNLGFESARVSGYAPGAYIPITAGLPGWAAGVDGSNKSATIYYDTQSLGGALISVNDANTGSGFTPIDGTFSAYLFSQGLGSPIATSISQTALVPGGITRAALSTCGRAKTKFLSLNYERARTQTDKDYEETAAAVGDKKQLTGEEEAELAKLWKKLVKLYHPDRFAHEPEKLETYEKLTAAINRAKDSGDIETLREIAEDPHGFILRQGWASLDFSEEAELTQLRRLYETLQLEIIGVIESLGQLRESPEYELWQISEKKPGVLDELAAERAKVLEKERAELEKEAERLAGEIEELAGEAPARIG